MNKIMIIGEAWGADEARERMPFVGASGWELTRMLEEAGINRVDCYLTNVFNIHPPSNRLELLCGGKETAIKGWPKLINSKKGEGGGSYVPWTLEPELIRLQSEILEVNPNLIVTCGNTPTWALLGRTGISKIRGTTHSSSHLVRGYKVLPTYHPAAVLRQWELRPVTVIDFQKALRESEFPDVKRPHREVWIEPNVEDLYTFARNYIEGCKKLSVDIETSGKIITCIGFSPDLEHAIVIPFVDFRHKDRAYWRNAVDERRAWKFVKDILATRTPKTFQNGLYDISFLWRAYGIKVYGAEDDTMLLHHALQPESPKALGFLGSVYTDEGSWKEMRKVATIKRDE